MLALPNTIGPDRCIADIKRVRWFDEIFHKLSCIFREVVLCEIANCAMTQTAPASHVAGKREERKRVERVEHDLYTITLQDGSVETQKENM